MSTALTKINNPISPSTTGFLLVLAVAIILYLVLKNKSTGQYLNEERWEIQRDEKGFTTSVIVHRDAKQG